ncbi:aldo/keto reductase [Amycolatopsis sp. GM8]|uniref:aldo/keto reductase n=1 Tax=Amycolatopsis sp. GM8 TaxID=2896530 RepID=UPI001F3375E6|nr:aldo/keto reductase [Amycolatopsis sp. GM8]
MAMSQTYGPADEAESIATINRALDSGISLLDTADIYGQGHNEQLVGRAVAGRRDQVVIATKFGFVAGGGGRRLAGEPSYVNAACEASLKRLGTEYIDLYLQHRVDPATPVEETVGAMADLVAAGKVRHIGLSEASAEQITRAHAVHPLTAVQNEWSLWTRDHESNGVLAAMRELGIGFIAFSPLGRGFLTGALNGPDNLAPADMRRTNPRFQAGNFAKNLELVDHLRELAAHKGCSVAQLALAWVLARGEDVVPIPGTKKLKNLEANIAADAIELNDDDLAALDDSFPLHVAAGARYPGKSE